MKPSLDEFKAQIEALFGQKLTGPAMHAAEDFWNNWSSFGALISARSLAVHVDTLRLSQNFPEYRRNWGGRVKFNDAKNFAENLMKEATFNPSGGGYAGLCANYIAGIIQLVTPSNSAHWPQYPSNVISEERTFIPT